MGPCRIVALDVRIARKRDPACGRRLLGLRAGARVEGFGGSPGSVWAPWAGEDNRISLSAFLGKAGGLNVCVYNKKASGTVRKGDDRKATNRRA